MYFIITQSSLRHLIFLRDYWHADVPFPTPQREFDLCDTARPSHQQLSFCRNTVTTWLIVQVLRCILSQNITNILLLLLALDSYNTTNPAQGAQGAPAVSVYTWVTPDRCVHGAGVGTAAAVAKSC